MKRTLIYLKLNYNQDVDTAPCTYLTYVCTQQFIIQFIFKGKIKHENDLCLLNKLLIRVTSE